MNDSLRLLLYCLEHPGDRARRLVYADAVEEAGDPARAALLRAPGFWCWSAGDLEFYAARAGIALLHGEGWDLLATGYSPPPCRNEGTGNCGRWVRSNGDGTWECFPCQKPGGWPHDPH